LTSRPFRSEVSFTGNPFAALEAELVNSGTTRNILLLAEFTGWSEESILSMPAIRLNNYFRDLNKIISERNDETTL